MAYRNALCSAWAPVTHWPCPAQVSVPCEASGTRFNRLRFASMRTVAMVATSTATLYGAAADGRRQLVPAVAAARDLAAAATGRRVL